MIKIMTAPLQRCAARAMVVLLLALLAASAPVAAQDRDVSIEAVFGWSGHMPAERWAPITIHITAADEPLSGIISVEFPQDTFQQATILAPFAAAAGQTTATQVLACIPSFCGVIKIDLLDERGRRITGARYSFDGDPRSRPLSPLLGAGHPVIVTVGRPPGGGITEAFRLAHADVPPPVTPGEFQPYIAQVPRSAETELPAAPAWEVSAATTIGPSELPLSAMAWDSVMVAVVQASDAAAVSQTAMAALHEWVLTGGWLVIVADAPGPTWERWLPGPAHGSVSLAEAERLPVPGPIRAVIEAAPPPEGRTRVAPAETIMVRRIQLAPGASRDGWGGPLLRDGTGVHGPVGFGHVTILGFDPHRTTEVVSGHAAAAVWKHILHDGASAWFSRRGAAARSPWYVLDANQLAINNALELLVRVPNLGFTVIWVIASAMVLLGLLVGPVDYFLLRRLRALQRSWLTALLWIAAASLIAAAAPRIIRTDPTRVSRLTMIDVLHERDGSVRTASTGLTGVYAGHAARLQLLDVDGASWWSGASVRRGFNETQGRAPLPMRQQAAGGAHGSRRGNTVGHLPMAQWTFRSLLDRSAGDSPLTAELARDGEGIVVTLGDLPGASTIRTAMLRLGDRLHPIAPSEAPHAAGAWIGATIPGSARQVSELVPGPSQYGEHRSHALGIIVPALMLPGTSARSASLESRLATGEWAALYVQLDGVPPKPALSQQAEHQHTVVARIVLPLPPLPADNSELP